MNTTSTRTEEFLHAVDGAHEWEEDEVYGGQGNLNVTITNTCSICGLQRRKLTFHIGLPRYEFLNSDGEKITLKEAAALEC
jgi:hypothetical protein